MEATFTAKFAHPFYGDYVLYHVYNLRPGYPTLRAWEFNGWPKESMSWRTGSYIHGVGIDSCGVPRLSLAPYVAGTGAARG